MSNFLLLDTNRALDFAKAEVMADHIAQVGHTLVLHHHFCVVAYQGVDQQIIIVSNGYPAFASVHVLMIIQAVAADVS